MLWHQLTLEQDNLHLYPQVSNHTHYKSHSRRCTHYLLCYCLCSMEEFGLRFSNRSHQQIIHLCCISATVCRALHTLTLCRTFHAPSPSVSSNIGLCVCLLFSLISCTWWVPGSQLLQLLRSLLCYGLLGCPWWYRLLPWLLGYPLCYIMLLWLLGYRLCYILLPRLLGCLLWYSLLPWLLGYPLCYILLPWFLGCLLWYSLPPCLVGYPLRYKLLLWL